MSFHESDPLIGLVLMKVERISVASHGFDPVTSEIRLTAQNHLIGTVIDSWYFFCSRATLFTSKRDWRSAALNLTEATSLTSAKKLLQAVSALRIWILSINYQLSITQLKSINYEEGAYTNAFYSSTATSSTLHSNRVWRGLSNKLNCLIAKRSKCLWSVV